MKRRGEDLLLGCVVVGFGLLVGLLMLGGLVFGVANALHEEERVCTVTEKERIYAGKDSGVQQRLHTEECGAFTVGDALFAGHFNSYDTWTGIEEGKTYRVTTRGYRVGFFSLFPNVIEAEEVTR